MTECPDCARAEMTRRERLVSDIAGAILRRYQSPAGSFLAAYAQTWRVFLGGAPEPTWYEKHRKRWEETGDERELARMLRHVA